MQIEILFIFLPSFSTQLFNFRRHLFLFFRAILVSDYSTFFKCSWYLKKVNVVVDSVYGKNLKLEHLIEDNIMEAITKNPGLQHISEDIFKLLDKKSLMDCRLVNSSWKNILDQPFFWIKKLNEMEAQYQENIEYMDSTAEFTCPLIRP